MFSLSLNLALPFNLSEEERDMIKIEVGKKEGAAVAVVVQYARRRITATTTRKLAISLEKRGEAK